MEGGEADKMLLCEVWMHIAGCKGSQGSTVDAGRENKQGPERSGHGSPISSVVMLPVSPSVPSSLIPCPLSISVSFHSSIPLGNGLMIKKKKKNLA